MNNTVIKNILQSIISVKITIFYLISIFVFSLKSRVCCLISNKRTLILKSIICILCVFSLIHAKPVIAIDTIGAEALTEFPTSALYSSIVNFRPGDGEVVKQNPPRFSWTYNYDAARPVSANGGIYAESEGPHEFIFQISYNSNLSNPIVNIRTPYNMYNFLAPLNTGQTVYWRVGYIKPSGSSINTWDLSSGSWESEPYAWSDVRTFTVAGNAVTWDRSMLADEAYLAEKGIHPHVLFSSSTRSEMYSFLQDKLNKYNTSTGQAWERTAGSDWGYNVWLADGTLTDTANLYWTRTSTNAGTYGGQTTGQIYPTNWATAISNVAFMWQMTKDDKYLAVDPAKALVNLSQWYVSVEGYSADTVSGVVDSGVITSIALAYDWLYEVMTPEQRASVLHALELNASYLLNSGWWYGSYNFNGCFGGSDPTGLYAGGKCVLAGSAGKVGGNHSMASFYPSMTVAFSAYADSAIVRKFFDAGLNYMIGVTYPHGSDGGMNQGRPYAYEGVGKGVTFTQGMVAQTIFPEVNFQKNPFFSINGDWWDRIAPVKFSEAHEPWGDTGFGPFTNWNVKSFGRDMALFLNDAGLYKHYEEEATLNQSYVAPEAFQELTMLKNFPLTSSEVSKPLSAVFQNQGWAMGSSLPTNIKNNFDKAVGFVLQARPRGSEGGHSNYSDLSFQLWAYGASITDGGDGMTSFGKVPMSNNSLFVNGRGPISELLPTFPYRSRIYAYKEAPDYTYVAVDGTKAYPKTNFQPCCWMIPSVTYNYYGNSELPNLVKVRRHLLFVKHKYFVIYDELENSTDSKFSWLYQIPTKYENVSVDKTTYTTDDTFSLNTASSSFTYNVGNQYPHVWYSHSPAVNVGVTVAHITSNPQNLDIVAMSGTTGATNNVYHNPISGEDYSLPDGQGQSLHGDLPNSHTVWVSNAASSTAFQFLTVIYPKNPDDSALPDPIIESLNDFTAKVTSPDGTVDVISFDPNTAASNGANFVVNTSVLEPTVVPSAGYQTAPLVTHTINASAGTNGSISPSGAVVVTDGYSKTFAITPNSGYVVDQVLADGNPVTLTADKYVFTGVTTNHTISASFVSDTVAPIISSVASSTSPTTATLIWSTNKASNSNAVYGLTTSYGLSTTSSAMTTSHSLILSNLTPSTLYFFEVASADSAGNTATSTDQTFTTTALPSPDTTPPLITEISSTPSQTSSSITFTTNENATSTISYGTTTSYASSTPIHALTKQHTLTLSNLTPSTTYHYKVTATDTLNNTATSTDQTFTTTAPPQNNTPSSGGSSGGGSPSSSSLSISCTLSDTKVAPNSHLTLSAKISKGESPYTLTWSTDNSNLTINPSSTTQTITPTKEETYKLEVKVTDAKGKTTTDTCTTLTVNDRYDLINQTPLLTNTPPLPQTPSSQPTYTFTQTLTQDQEGTDALHLQIYLNTHGYPVNFNALPGSPGHESTYFGNRTSRCTHKVSTRQQPDTNRNT